MAENPPKDQKQLTEVEQYRNEISCKLKRYIASRLTIVVLCLVCAGFLTYLVGGFGKQLQINMYGKILMVGFIALAIILAGFIIYRMPLHYKRVQTALIRLDALITRAQLVDRETGYRAAKAVYDAVQTIAKSKADETAEMEGDAKAIADAVSEQLTNAAEAAKAALPEQLEHKRVTIINLDRELQMIVRILESLN